MDHPQPSQSLAASKRKRRTDKKLYLRARERAQLRTQSLELDILNLRQEIEALRNTRRLLHARVLNRYDSPDGRFARILREYYQLIRHGFTEVVWDAERQRLIASTELLRAMFDEQARLGDATVGHRGIMADLTRLTALMDDLHLSVDTIHVEESAQERPDEQRPSVTLMVKTITSSRISDFTLSAMFPHLGMYPHLRSSLKGQRLFGHGVSRYQFDITSGLITKVDVRADLRGAFERLLGDTGAIHVLFEHKDVLQAPDLIAHERQRSAVPYKLRISSLLSPEGAKTR